MGKTYHNLVHYEITVRKKIVPGLRGLLKKMVIPALSQFGQLERRCKLISCICGISLCQLLIGRAGMRILCRMQQRNGNDFNNQNKETDLFSFHSY